VKLRSIATPQHRDSPMAVCHKVRDGGLSAAGVVGQHDIGVEIAGRTVDEHEWEAGSSLALQVAVVAGDGRDDQPVNSPRNERFGEVVLALS
jgi:hypothetical protein